MVFVGFKNFSICFLNMVIFVTLGEIFWFYSTTFFNNVNIMFIENFCKLSFASYSFIFFSNAVVPKNPLFATISLMTVQTFVVFFVLMPLFLTLLRKEFLFRETQVSLSFISCYVYYGRTFVHFVFQSLLV